MKKILFLMVFLYTSWLHAQLGSVPASLTQELKSKKTLQSVMQTVYNHYGLQLGQELDSTSQSKIDKKVVRSLKHWNRWAYFMSSRTGPKGELVDVNSLWTQNSIRTQESSNNFQQSEPNTGNWTLVGPTNIHYGHDRIIGIGRIDRITFHPTDPDIYFVSSGEGGVWKTSDGGNSYTCLTDDLPIVGCSGIVVDYNNPSTLYMLSGNGDSGGLISGMGYRHSCLGVYKSTNGGANWSLTGPLFTPGSYLGYQLVQNPTDPQTLLAATNDGIYRTTNGGTSWIRTTAKGTFHDVKYKPGSGTIAYCIGIVSGTMNFYYSTNGGLNWLPAKFDKTISNANRGSIGVSPAANKNVYLILGPGSLPGGTYTGTFVSNDEGKNFTRRHNATDIFLNDEGRGSDQSGYDNCITVKPSNANIIVTGGLVIYRSTNGGTNYSQMTTYLDGVSQERDDYIHPDVHAVAYNPLNNKLYACSDGGVFVSTNDGANWSRKYNSLAVSQIYHLSKLDGNNTQFMMGNQDNGIHTRYSDNSDFTQSVQGDGFDMDFFDNTNNRFFGVVNTTVYKFFTEGLTKKELMDFNPNFFPSMAKHLTDDDLVFIGNPGKAQIHFYDLDGIDDITTYNIPSSWYICQAPTNTSRLYVAGEKTAFNADSGQINRYDGDGSWTRIDNKPGFPDLKTMSLRVTCIAVHPDDHDKVWVSLGGFFAGQKVFYSSNGGNSWTNLTGSLPNLPILSLVVDVNGNLYAGGDDGIFFRGTGWADWKPFYNGIPRVPVTDLILTSNNYIFASTFGRGVWRSEQYSDCPTTLDISGTQNGQKFFEASGTVNTTGKSTAGLGTQVFYRAGDKVDLKDGFRASNESEVKVYNGPCSSGIPSLFRKNNEENTTLANYRKAALPMENSMEFPYAHIGNWTRKGNTIQFKIDILQEGETSLILSNREGTNIRTLWNSTTIGKNKPILSIPELNDQQCTVLLFHNNVLVHWQDLNSKVLEQTK